MHELSVHINPELQADLARQATASEAKPMRPVCSRGPHIILHERN